MRQALNLGLGAAVDVVIEFAAEAVLRILTVLTHHDHRRLDGGERGEKQIEQDEGIGIPGGPAQSYVDGSVNDQDKAKRRDEGPRSAKASHGVRDALSEGGSLLDDRVRVSHGTNAHQ